MKILVLALMGIILQAPGTEVTSVFAIAEKLTTIALLAVGVYVLYKRDVAKERKMDDLQTKIFELEKNSLTTIGRFEETLSRMDSTLEKFIDKIGIKG